LVAREKFLRHAPSVLAARPNASVGDLAAAAGASRASFYRHFKSRQALLEALEVTPEPGTADRILEAAVEAVGEIGLTALSMDEVAERARVSRATLYRLFPGKAPLLAALVQRYSPLEPVAQLMAARGDEPPEVLMPEVARTAYRAVAGRTGLMRALFFEVSGLSPATEEVAAQAITQVAGLLAAYVSGHMAAGRLRPMHPLLALQDFIGPIFFHILTRPLAERVLHLDVDGESAVTQLAEAWLRAMAVKEEGA
jgi:AcrR family transcriptional regulator